MALGRAVPDGDGLVHHSDRGSAYTLLDFTSAATPAGLEVSFGPLARGRWGRHDRWRTC